MRIACSAVRCPRAAASRARRGVATACYTGVVLLLLRISSWSHQLSTGVGPAAVLSSRRPRRPRRARGRAGPHWTCGGARRARRADCDPSCRSDGPDRSGRNATWLSRVNRLSRQIPAEPRRGPSGSRRDCDQSARPMWRAAPEELSPRPARPQRAAHSPAPPLCALTASHRPTPPPAPRPHGARSVGQARVAQRPAQHARPGPHGRAHGIAEPRPDAVRAGREPA